MPAHGTRSTLLRQWEMLRLLPSWPQTITYSDLAKKLQEEHEDFQVTSNTIRRDLEQLSTIFPIYVEEQGKTHYVCWAKGSDPVLRTLNVGEAVALRLAEQHLSQLLPTAIFESIQPALSRAQLLLEGGHGKNPGAAWISKVRAVSPMQPMLPPVISPGIQDTLSRALVESHQVEVRYGRAKVSQLLLNPLGLIYRAPSLYLVATSVTHENVGDIRLYALHRFHEVHLLDSPVETPDGFDLDKLLEQGLGDFGGTAIPITLRLHVTADLRAILEETPLAIRANPPHAEQSILPQSDGTAIVEAKVSDTWQLQWWLDAHKEQIIHCEKI